MAGGAAQPAVIIAGGIVTGPVKDRIKAVTAQQQEQPAGDGKSDIFLEDIAI